MRRGDIGSFCGHVLLNSPYNKKRVLPDYSFRALLKAHIRVEKKKNEVTYEYFTYVKKVIQQRRNLSSCVL